MMSPKVRWPSQRSRTCLPVPCNLIAPSGNRITRSASVPPQRHPAARRGWLVSEGGATSTPFRDAKCAGRWPSGLHVGEIERIELRPQDVTFIAERLDREILLGTRPGILVDVVDGELCVFGGLRQACHKIIQPAGEPRIVLAQLLHAQ